MTGVVRSVSLAMYPTATLRPAYERLWRAIVDRAPDLPAELTWPADVHATWADDTVVVKQTCGWPLVTDLGDRVSVIGAFEPDIAGAEGHRYRSVIVATSPAQPAEFVDATVAYNSADSLSGWVSLMAWSGRSGASLRRSGVRSGSHEASLEMLQSVRANVASIDAVTLAHVRRHRPDLLDGLHEIGQGPLVPSLPIVAPARVGDDTVDRIRTALAAVVADDAIAATCDELLIAGFVPLDLDDYRRDLAHLRAD